jgi:hypothetical protein
MFHLRNRRLTLALAGAFIALGPATSAQALTGTATHTSSTPTFPLPASARVHPSTGGTGTPTTTYVPSETATPLPGAAAKGLATNPTAPTGTPFKSTLNARAHTHARAQPSDTRSTEAIVIAALAALLALGCAAWGIARRRAFEPHWVLSLRHAMAEAGFRASATWAEFADWVRLGH